jgi:hypothetical protein
MADSPKKKKQAPVKKAPAAKTAPPAKKAPAAKTAPPAKKAPAKKAPAKKAPGKKAPAQKAPAKKAPAKRLPAKKLRGHDTITGARRLGGWDFATWRMASDDPVMRSTIIGLLVWICRPRGWSLIPTSTWATTCAGSACPERAGPMCSPRPAVSR